AQVTYSGGDPHWAPYLAYRSDERDPALLDEALSEFDEKAQTSGTEVISGSIGQSVGNFVSDFLSNLVDVIINEAKFNPGAIDWEQDVEGAAQNLAIYKAVTQELGITGELLRSSPRDGEIVDLTHSVAAERLAGLLKPLAIGNDKSVTIDK